MSLHEPMSRAVSLRRDIIQKAVGIFRGWSYRDIEVPLLDYLDLPLDQAERAADLKRTFQVVDREGNVLTLRADVTPAVARLYARQLHGRPGPLRVCYANRIVRAERAFGRQQSESYQIGVEMIGEAGLLPDLEVILICLETLEAIDVHDFQLNVGHLAIYRHLIRRTGLPRQLREEVHQAIIERDPYEVRQILLRCGTRANVAEALEVLASLRDGEAQIRRIRELLPRDQTLEACFEHLGRLMGLLGELGYGGQLNLDLGDIQGPEYYSGMIFRIVSERIGRILGGGGRYDELCGLFGVDAPGVGFALMLDALVELLEPTEAHRPVRPAGSAIRIDPRDPLAGLREALDRRRNNQITLLVASSGAPPQVPPGRPGQGGP